jgi:tetratricopeptide (TPR) repeat protein
MPMSKPLITGTTHILPFDKLSPRDFERLCLWLVEREGYERAEHLGAAGGEQGRDIIAWRGHELWAFQCKRVQRFGPQDALTEVEKVLALPEGERPVGLVFLITCDVSANTRHQVRGRCAGEMECSFWTGTELDEKVKQHRDVMSEFFRSHQCSTTIIGNGNVVGNESVAQVAKVEGSVIGLTQVAGDYYAAPFVSVFPTAPAPLARFVGRQRELDTLSQVLTASDTSQVIIALQGMGGIGKTALAAQLVATLREAFPGGCFWADLAAHNGDPFSILDGWGRLCGLTAIGQSGDPVSVARAALAAQADRRGRFIVVLDDVRSAWLDGANMLKSALPAQASLLLTTRDEEIALALDAEVYRLDVLPLQQAIDMLQGYIGAAKKQCDPSELQALARRLGCLPLALELACKLAARLMRKPGWSLKDLLSRLETGPSKALELKNRSVYDTFRISYDGLAPEQQRLFRWLGAFVPGSFTPGWVVRILDWDQWGAIQRAVARQRAWANEFTQIDAGRQKRIEEQLDQLVGLSLVQWTEGGYRLHPLLRDYACTELRRSGEFEAAARAHSEVFLYLCRAYRDDYDTLDRTRTNILAGMDAAFEREDWASVRGYMWGLGPDGRYMVARGYWQELRQRLSQALTAARAEGYERDVAAFSINLGIAAQRLRDYQQAWQSFDSSLELGRRLGNDYIVARALHQSGMLAQASGDLEQARTAYEASLNIKEHLSDPRGLANSMAQLGTLAQAQGKHAEANDLYAQSLELFTQLGNPRGMAAVRHQMGSVALAQKHFDAAETAYQDSLALWQRVNDKRGTAAVRHQLGKLAQLQGNYNRARAEYQTSRALKQELGDEHGLAITESNLAAVAYVEGDFDAAVELYQRAVAIFRRTGDRAEEAMLCYQLGLVAQEISDNEAARDAYSKSLTLFKELEDERNISRVQVALQKLAGD